MRNTGLLHIYGKVGSDMARAKIITVGLKEAVALLNINDGNRPVSQAVVARLRGAMLRGEWRLSPDAIAIEGPRNAPGSRLRNGQHRLTALMFAAEEQPTLALDFVLVDDLTPDVVDVIDIGKIRTLADVLAFKGETDVPPRFLAPAIQLAWHVANGSYHHRIPTPTRVQLLDFLKDNADLREAVGYGAQMARGCKVSSAGTSVAAWLIRRGGHRDEFDDFASQLATGEDVHDPMMSYRLRERFIHSGPYSFERRSWQICALTITAWNAHVSASPIVIVRSHPDSIPTAL